jgi:hypothetical protein
MAIGAVAYGAVAIGLKLAGLPYVPGYASLLVTVTFLSGVQLIVIGMVGQYVARIYDEVRARPLYLVREAHGFGDRGQDGAHDHRARDESALDHQDHLTLPSVSETGTAPRPSARSVPPV